MTTYIGAAPSAPGQWTYITTLQYAAETTKTAGSLAAYDEYFLGGVISGSTQNDGVKVQLNGDTGTNYTYTEYGGGSMGTTAGATGTTLASFQTANQPAQNIFQTIIAGKTGANANGTAGICNISMPNNDNMQFGGNWKGGNAIQVTSITVYRTGSGTLTGKVDVWGRNFQ